MTVELNCKLKCLDRILATHGPGLYRKTVVDCRRRFHLTEPGRAELADEFAMLMLLREIPLPGGSILAEAWEREGFDGLNNDERFALRHWLKCRAALMEIQRIEPARDLVHVIDLLQPAGEVRIAVDRTLARERTRFERILCWITSFPHMVRFSAWGTPVPLNLFRPFLEALAEQAGVSGDPLAAGSRPVIQQYIQNHYAETLELLTRVGEQGRDALLGQMDLRHFAGWYSIVRDREQIGLMLNNRPEFLPSEQQPEDGIPSGGEGFDWLSAGETVFPEGKGSAFMTFAVTPGGKQTRRLGLLWLYKNRVIISAMTEEVFRFLQAQLIKLLGDRVRFEHETVRDLRPLVTSSSSAVETGRAAGSSDVYDELDEEMDDRFGDYQEPEDDLFDFDEDDPDEEDEESPRELDNRLMAMRGQFHRKLREKLKPAADKLPPEIRGQALSKFYQLHYMNFLDIPVPALRDATPRQAAADPVLRPLLVELMKDHLVMLEQRRREEPWLTFTLQPCLKELDLPELM